MVKISIIFPCYNEADGIPHLAEQIVPVLDRLKTNYEVELLFIDDGSSDNTYDLLTGHFRNVNGARIIRHTKNRNLGGAIKTGFANATGDLVATFDSDCTYSPAIIFIMLEMIKNADVVSAYAGNTQNVPRYRMFLSNSASKIYQLLVSPKVKVYTCLVRLYRKEVVDNIHFNRNDFLAVLEIMVKTVLKGYRVKELPATLGNRKFGDSKMNTLKVIGQHMQVMGKITSSRLFGTKF